MCVCEMSEMSEMNEMKTEVCVCTVELIYSLVLQNWSWMNEMNEMKLEVNVCECVNERNKRNEWNESI